ncbi:RAP domain-containing, putative [Babesia ovis]|uniref:RAP domain-containing, putative n=1 Tax=Babesia ovis TaxID=5869 RepID=A0A9W5TAX2_BABOV|nr:RAP domain-containing, putative [Babesia ovis]
MHKRFSLLSFGLQYGTGHCELASSLSRRGICTTRLALSNTQSGEISQCVNTHTVVETTGTRTTTAVAWPWPENATCDLEASNTEDNGIKETKRSVSYRKRPKLSNKVIKRIRSIERLYRPTVVPSGDTPLQGQLKAFSGCISNNDLLHSAIKDEDIAVTAINLDSVDITPGSNGVAVTPPRKEYEPTKTLIKNIYRAATGGVLNDALWKRYVNQLSMLYGTLQPPDICLVMYSFAKVRYRDQQLIKLFAPLIVRNISNLSCGGCALILNAMKRLEIRNYDIIELATNEICLKMDHANLQDISLTANALSFFQIYHQRFWNMLTKAVSLRHHQMTALQGSLLLAAMAKLDIRNPLILRLLKDKLRPAVEKGELPQELLTLNFHSLAKLDFAAKNFYEACVAQFNKMLDERPESIDTQSLVLYLYTAVCMLELGDKTVEKTLQQLATRKDLLTNYKTAKMKWVTMLEDDHKGLVQPFGPDIKDLFSRIQQYRLRKVRKGLSRWAMEVSQLLKKHNVDHARNVWFDYLHADIYIKDLGVVVKCAGPYSYYAMSNKLTAFAQVEVEALNMKGTKVCLLPYYEWNALKTDEDKVKYLKKFGETWAAVHFQRQE